MILEAISKNALRLNCCASASPECQDDRFLSVTRLLGNDACRVRAGQLRASDWLKGLC